MEASDIGVTGVDYAISETGTCVIIPRAGVSRLVSLLPPVHIALVEKRASASQPGRTIHPQARRFRQRQAWAVT